MQLTCLLIIALTNNYIPWTQAITDAHHNRLYMYHSLRLPLISNMIPTHNYYILIPSCESDIGARLSSDDFNLSRNLGTGHSRGGLDLA
ncbi:hypothetical protein L873DRAFT_1817743 [Choiromyces venosus 120613-1]|uniref:Uncharacterized protein n=1 Tax=Choiromyces venosus 120613-1 TaxID=1336337 RepID=A0A3N4J6Y6_9PEZI|nr:hypothetical protein L873DRAFT_1817743 [Choiromyces venosus 120613-1]